VASEIEKPSKVALKCMFSIVLEFPLLFINLATIGIPGGASAGEIDRLVRSLSRIIT
jgi:hypothetical protein